MSAAQSIEGLISPLLGGGALPLRIRGWDGSEAGPPSAPVLQISSRQALRRLLWRPNELGLAQAYITGEIDVPGGAGELAAGLRDVWALAQDGMARPTLSAAEKARAALVALRLGAVGPPLPAPASQARVEGTMHSVERDRRVISHHYDLSNDFYSLFMDSSMAYSCAWYEDDDATLAQAQVAKLDMICRKLELQPGMRLLDVGCGWGSLVLHAAEHFGVRALGVTLSHEQQAYATQQIAERGLTGTVEVRLQDYRALDDAPFDAVASIEMGEHVGEANYARYVDVLWRHLLPGRRLLLQQMSRHADAAPGGGPFIEHYIAPDMHMRPLPETVSLLAAAGFCVKQQQPMGEHYVRTVADWLDAFESRYDEVVAMIGEEQARVWRLYLVGGGLSFEDGRMGVDQITAVRP